MPPFSNDFILTNPLVRCIYFPKTKTRNQVNINSITLPLPDVLRYNFNINLLKYIKPFNVSYYYTNTTTAVRYNIICVRVSVGGIGKRVLERHPAYTTLTVRINIIQQ